METKYNTTGKDIVKLFFKQYMENRDLEKTAQLLSDDIHWIGTSEKERAYNKNEVIVLLKEEFLSENIKYRVAINELEETKIADAIYNVTGVITLTTCDENEAMLRLRMTFTCKNTNEGLKICSAHASFAAVFQDEDEYTPVSFMSEKLNEVKEDFVNKSLPCGFVIISVNPYKMELVNDAFIRMLGYESREEFTAVCGESIGTFIHPDDLERIAEEGKKRNGRFHSYKMTYRMIKKDGACIWIDERSQHIRNINGKELVFAYYTDITEQKKAEEKFRLESQKYETLVNSIPGGVGIYKYDANFTPIYFSDRVSELCSMTREEYTQAIKESALAVIHPDDVGGFYNEIVSGVSEGRKIEYTYRLLQKTGGYRWVHISADRISGEEDVPIFIAVFFDISKQKSVENDLREAKEKYKIALKNSNIIMWRYDIKEDIICDFTEISKNFGFFNMTEISYEEIISEGIIHEESKEAYRELHNQVKNGAKETSAIIHFNKQKVDIEWQSIKYITIFDDENQPIGAIGLGEDLTEMKALEARYNRELMNKIMMHKTSKASCNINLTKNQIAERTENLSLGRELTPFLTAQDLLDAIIIHIIDDKQKEQFYNIFNIQNLIESFHSGKGEFELAYKYDAGDNDYVWLLTHMNVMKNPKTGDIEGFAYTNDITEEKMPSELINSVMEKDYDYIMRLNVKSNSYTMYSKDSEKETSILTCGDYENQVYKYSQKFVDESEIDSVLNKLSLSTVCEQLEKNDLYETIVTVNSNGVRLRKKLQFSYIDRDLKIVLHTRTDVTDLLKSEERQNRKLKKALETAEQASLAKTEFLSRMSHEIRTPMNAIIGMAELAKTRVDNPEFISECINKSQIASKYLLSLINDMLDMSRIESGRISLKKERINCKEFVDGVITIIAPSAAEKDIDFIVEIVNTCANSYIGDTIRLQQILINLLSNAVKFTPNGGTVKFKIEQTKSDREKATIKFTVSDTGIGIGQNYIPNIFKPFSQEHSGITTNYGGSGLGLAISHNLASLMGGDITVTSELGVGTEFVVEIVADHTTESNENMILNANTEIDNNSCFKGRRILLVEDHSLNIMVASKLLESKNIEVVVAKNGKIGSDLFIKSDVNSFDAILMDIRMPVMDGMQATNVIRSSSRPDSKTIPIIAMTANAFKEDIEKALAIGMNGHLAKPIEPKKMFSLLAQFFN